LCRIFKSFFLTRFGSNYLDIVPHISAYRIVIPFLFFLIPKLRVVGVIIIFLCLIRSIILCIKNKMLTIFCVEIYSVMLSCKEALTYSATLILTVSKL
jgi:hypothetical protein